MNLGLDFLQKVFLFHIFVYCLQDILMSNLVHTFVLPMEKDIHLKFSVHQVFQNMASNVFFEPQQIFCRHQGEPRAAVGGHSDQKTSSAHCDSPCLCDALSSSDQDYPDQICSVVSQQGGDRTKFVEVQGSKSTSNLMFV